MLLVRHQHDSLHGGRSWWVPPGGGVEGQETLLECAKRETLEETGLSVELGKLAYVREYLEPETHHFEVFFMATSYTGSLTMRSDTGIFDVDQMIKEVRFVRRDEMRDMVIYPPELKDEFWDDLETAPPGARYLGATYPESDADLG